MKQLLQSFSNKKFRYGAFSTLTALFVIAILVVVNLVVGQINLSYDLTPDKLYTLSDKTKEIVKELDQDVTIYALFKTGQENDLYKELLEQYPSENSRIKVVYKDPYLYPQFVESYAKNGQKIKADSLIIESAKRSKVINAEDLVLKEVNYDTWQEYVTGIDIEPQVTNAINYVMLEKTAKIYTVSNHEEMSIPADLQKQFSMANFEIETLDLLMATEIPSDCDILMVTTPSMDWTADEARVVKEYLENDGNAIVFVDFTSAKFSNMESILTAYGIEFGDYLVVEGNTNNYLQNNPVWLLPNMSNHDITKDFISKNYRVFFPCERYGVRGIDRLSLVKSGTVIEPLLTTSKESFGKAGKESVSVSKEPGDIDGPFDVAVAVTDTMYTDVAHETKLVVAGTTYLMDQRVSGTNFDFVISAANWIQGQEPSIYISPKTGTNTTLEFNQQQAIYMIVFSLLILPAVIFGTGLFVWLRRRHS